MGEYTLADGTSVSLDENGIIVEMEAPETETMPEEATEEEAPADMAKDYEKKMKEYAEQFEAQVAELKAEKEASDKKVAELEAKVKQGFAQVAELVEALSNTPTAEPTQKAANAFQSYVSTNDSKYERLEKYRNAILNKQIIQKRTKHYWFLLLY
jgi:type I site-specific restriction-modification system R (restriction) subunit